MPSTVGIKLIRRSFAGRSRPPTHPIRRCLMQVALYARVSTTRQAQAQTIDQQLTRLRAWVAEHSWTLDATHVYCDDGFSGASLNRPALDQLRDAAAQAAFAAILITAPDRLARKYLHQVLL